MNTRPIITVGMPVYNGARTLDGAMRSLLDQTFTDIELLVSDNASTDATAEVVMRIAATDSRVRYVRQSRNIGANGNYSFVARDARGQYLKWASASDLSAPTFLARCVEALEAAPDAVLAAPRTRLFEGDVSRGTDYHHDFALLAESPVDRLNGWMELCRLNNAFNGLIRLSALRRTNLVEPYLHADTVMMGHLALLGKFLLIDEHLYFRRMEVTASTTLQKPEDQLRHHYPQQSARMLMQHWKQHIGWFRAALAAPLLPDDRLEVMKVLARRSLWFRRTLMRDLLDVVKYASQSRA